MEEMELLAANFWKQHRGSGRVSTVTEYSFTWETLPDKNGKVTSVTYMKSYFLELGGNS